MNNHQNPDGTYDGIAVMSSVTGLPRKTVAEIAEEVRANHALLHDCPYHEFAPIQPRVKAGQRYRCIECGGEVDHHAWLWHERGRRAP